jgi:Cu(I)/Ag(I) efflux system protein CusF
MIRRIETRRTILCLLALATVTAAAPIASAAEPPLADGEVRKIDAGANKITLKHGPIKNLDMDGMTMVFRIKDAGLLKGLKVGDKVRFTAERVEGAITITRLEKAK